MYSWFKNNLLRASRSAGLRAGVALNAKSFSLAVVRRTPGGIPVLEHCVHESVDGAVEPALASALQKLHMRRTPINAVVGAEDYQLVQVEAPDVLPAELRAAVRWRLRDVISFHIDDAVIDVFEIPDQSRRAQARMMFAVAARSSSVQRIVSAVSPAAEALDAIDVPELCLRNLAALLPQDQRGVALLVLSETSAQLLLTRQGVLYLARRIEFARRFALNAAPGEIDASALALEIQRSLDYYESHFDQTAVGDLVIAPDSERSIQLAAALKDETSLRISLLKLDELMTVADGVQRDDTAACLTAIGAALRVDELQL